MRAPLTLPICDDNSVDDIPAFLRVENRKPLTPEQQSTLAKAMAVASAPQRARDDMRAMQRATKREKSRVRIERLLAKKSVAAAQMPLSGKAALAAIVEARSEAKRARRRPA